MPDRHEGRQGFPHLFIWYHAPGYLEADLREWLRQVQQELGIEGELFLREERDVDGNPRMTFMETYRNVNEELVVQLESLASRQPWFQQLDSPRRCEAFNRIE